MSATPPAAPWQLTYHDGNNNRYRFWQAETDDAVQFRYTPITPERSSSGVYSGGAPQSGTLTNEQVDKLWRWILRLETEVAQHATKRTKGSGALRTEVADHEKTWLVKNSSLLAAFNTFLAPYRSN